jgi:hypothetical protein
MDMLFNSPIEVEQARFVSGRSPDLRFIETGQPSRVQTPQWLPLECRFLSVHSYGVVAESHRLPEHQMGRL